MSDMSKDEIRRKADEIWKRAPKGPMPPVSYKPLIVAGVFFMVFISLFFGYHGISSKDKKKDANAPAPTANDKPDDKNEMIINIPPPRLDPKDQERILDPKKDEEFRKSIAADLEALAEIPVVSSKSPQLLYLMGVVHKMPAEEVRLRVDPRLTIEDLYKNPTEHMGKFVRIEGRTSYESGGEEPVDIATAQEIRRIFFGMIFIDASRDLRVIFYTPNDPSDVVPRKHIKYFRDTTPVEIEGMFLRVYDYVMTGENGQRGRAAIIAVKSIRRTGQADAAKAARDEETVEQTRTLINVIIIAIAVVVVVFIIAAAALQRRHREISVRERIDKMKRDLLVKEGRLRKPEGGGKNEIIGDPMPKGEYDKGERPPEDADHKPTA